MGRRPKVWTECAWCREKFKSTTGKNGNPRARFCSDQHRIYWHREQARQALLDAENVTVGVVTE